MTRSPEAARPLDSPSTTQDDLKSRLQSSEAAHAQALALLRTVPSGVSAEVDAWRREATLAALSEKLDLEVSQSQPGADVGPIAHARTEAEPSAAWRPIETAPRDGTSVLLAHASNGAVFDGAWENGAWVDGATDLYDEPVEYHPSHWMPLPEAPK